jgi:hypothetical protein
MRREREAEDPKEPKFAMSFRGYLHTHKGKVVLWMQRHPSGGVQAAWDAAFACYLPLALEVKEENRSVALEQISRCEAFARAGRERWGFADGLVISQAVSNGKLSTSEPPEEALDKDEQAQFNGTIIH